MIVFEHIGAHVRRLDKYLNICIFLYHRRYHELVAVAIIIVYLNAVHLCSY